MPTTQTELRVLHSCMDACIHDALTHEPALLPGYGSTLHLVWDDEALARQTGLPQHAITAIGLLHRQAARYDAMGCGISAGDCYFLAAKIRGGALRFITNDTWAALAA